MKKPVFTTLVLVLITKSLTFAQPLGISPNGTYIGLKWGNYSLMFKNNEIIYQIPNQPISFTHNEEYFFYCKNDTAFIYQTSNGEAYSKIAVMGCENLDFDGDLKLHSYNDKSNLYIYKVSSNTPFLTLPFTPKMYRPERIVKCYFQLGKAIHTKGSKINIYDLKTGSIVQTLKVSSPEAVSIDMINGNIIVGRHDKKSLVLNPNGEILAEYVKMNSEFYDANTHWFTNKGRSSLNVHDNRGSDFLEGYYYESAFFSPDGRHAIVLGSDFFEKWEMYSPDFTVTGKKVLTVFYNALFRSEHNKAYLEPLRQKELELLADAYKIYTFRNENEFSLLKSKIDVMESDRVIISNSNYSARTVKLEVPKNLQTDEGYRVEALIRPIKKVKYYGIFAGMSRVLVTTDGKLLTHLEYTENRSIPTSDEKWHKFEIIKTKYNPKFYIDGSPVNYTGGESSHNNAEFGIWIDGERAELEVKYIMISPIRDESYYAHWRKDIDKSVDIAWAQREEVKQIKEAAQKSPQNQSLSENLANDGWALFGQKKYSEAVAAFTKSLDASAANLNGYLGRSIAYFELGKFDLGQADLDKAQMLYPDNAFVQVFKGWGYLLNKQYDRAKTHVFKAYVMAPDLYNAVANVGNYYFLTGNDELAYKLYVEALGWVSNPDEFTNFCGDLETFSNKGWRSDHAQKLKARVNQTLADNKSKFLEMIKFNQKASEYVDAKSYELAIAEFSKVKNIALTLNPIGLEKALACSYLNGVYSGLLGRKDEELKHYNEAIDFAKRGNSIHPLAAEAYNYAGLIYKDQGNFSQALENFNQALVINQKLFDDVGVAVMYSNAGEAYANLGDSQKAIESYERSIELDTKSNRKIGLAISYNNLGSVYKDIGNFDKAADCYDKSIAIAEAEKFDMLSTVYSMKGYLYLMTADYRQALELFNKSLALDEKAGNKLATAKRLASIGDVYATMKQPDKAIEYLNRSLSIGEREADAAALAYTYSTLANAYMDKKDIGKSKEFYEKALKLNRQVNKQESVAAVLANLAEIYSIYTFDPLKAMDYYNESESIYRKLNLRHQLAQVLNSKGALGIAIASSSGTLTQLDNSIKHFNESITIKEELIKNTKGDTRLQYLASMVHTYELLTAAYIYMGKYTEAFNTIEISRAKMLAEKLSAGANVKPVSLAQVQAKLSDKSVVLYYANTAQNPMTLMTITKTSIQGYQIDKAKFIEKIIPQFGSDIDKVITNQRGFKRIEPPVTQEVAPKKQEHVKLQSDLENIISYYRSLIPQPNSVEMQQRAGTIAAELYKMLLSPAAQSISGRTELIIIPDGILAYLPYETLKESNANYLIQDYDIRYLHSLTVNDLIGKRSYPATRKSLLAFGGAAYESISVNAKLIQTDQEYYELYKQANKTIAEKGSLRKAYASLGITSWQSLPGTVAEVNNIKGIVPDARLVLAADVNEKNLKSMSSSGELSSYKTIHFATHGVVTPEIPALSALVLSQFTSPRNDEDGYLTMREIEQLKIQADFVNLSACETGLGKIYGGEGVVGLSQSFLVAGAIGLSVSLWQVDDESTSIFMTGMYMAIKQQQSNSYHEAIAKMKRDFINGSHGDKYKNPYYWAPFVYYGN
jgi:CHAT domain-containing protein/lipoprotein NlpI